MLKNLNWAKQNLSKKFSDVSNWGTFPCVLKITSNRVLHKTDIGGVKIVYAKSDFEKAYNELIKVIKLKRLNDAKILIREYVDGKELILGIKKDEVFGHIVLLGMGGVLTELIDDVSIRKCPIEKEEVVKMIEELKFKKLLYGYRDKSRVNVNSVIDAVVKVSNLPKKYPKINELDINPFIVNSKEGKVCDARIVLN